MKLKRILKKMLYIITGTILILTIIVVAVVNHYASFGGKPTGYRLERMLNSPNNNEGVFSNLSPVNKDYGWEFTKKMIKKQLKGNPHRKPIKSLPFIKWSKEEVQNLNDSITTVVWYGHSAFYLKMNGKNILLDPMFGDYPSPIPYTLNKRFNDTLPIAISDLPIIDVILLSHDHYDHLDYGSILELKNKTKQFIVPLGVGAHLEKWGVDASKITELNWYEDVTIDEMTFSCTPAQHFSGRGITDKFRTLWCSWVIDGKHKIFFSGDSGYFDEFKKIGEKYGPFDVCMIECGQYDKLWDDIHMFPEQTAQAHIDLKGNMLIPIHWGGFTLATHDWNDPIIRLSKVCKQKDINLATPIIGEKITIGRKQEFSSWWKTLK